MSHAELQTLQATVMKVTEMYINTTVVMGSGDIGSTIDLVKCGSSLSLPSSTCDSSLTAYKCIN